jgi:hypothetical protein
MSPKVIQGGGYRHGMPFAFGAEEPFPQSQEPGHTPPPDPVDQDVTDTELDRKPHNFRVISGRRPA